MRLLNAERTTIVSSLNAETRAVSSSREGGAAFCCPMPNPEHQKRADVPRAPPAGHEQAGGADPNAARFKAATLGTL